MNYLLIVIILILSGGLYYMHMQDQQQIDSLQTQLATAQTALAAAPTPAPAPVASAPSTASAPAPAPAPMAATINTVAKTHDLDSPPPVLNSAPATPTAPVKPGALVVLQPEIHSSAIDAAASAAQAAANSASIGNITTLDNHTYTNCKVLKVEEDGVTFSHDDGITKILYPMMPPAVQAKFGYTPQEAVAQTEAQIRAEQDQAAATNAPANP